MHRKNTKRPLGEPFANDRHGQKAVVRCRCDVQGCNRESGPWLLGSVSDRKFAVVGDEPRRRILNRVGQVSAP